jgi:ketosteroid isomerase-like protein
MSQENVEIVQRAIAAYVRTGEPDEDLFDPEIAVWESPELPGELAGKGYGNLIRANETLLDSFEEWSIEPERFFDLGERVLVFVVVRVLGKGSGVPVDGEQAHLFTLRNGRVVEWGLFGDRSKALEAAGVSE